jgi:hypothetical protein
LDVEPLYPFLVAQIKRFMKSGELVVGDALVAQYLRELETPDIASLEIGDFPGIEALGFAVIEMRRYFERADWDYPDPAGDATEDLLEL